jgi:hypothetical protein
MADRESVLRWMGEKHYRVVRDNDPVRGIVNRLVREGKARWLGAANRCQVTECQCGTTYVNPGPHIPTCALGVTRRGRGRAAPRAG